MEDILPETAWWEGNNAVLFEHSIMSHTICDFVEGNGRNRGEN